MILALGEILFDIFPTYKRLGGAPFNFAAHLKRFDFPTYFVSRVGEDENGEKILNLLREQGFDHRFIQVDSKRVTGHVQVKLDEKGSPTFNIVENVAYDHLDYTNEIAAVLDENIRLVYFGTLIQRSRKGFETVQTVLKNRHPNTRCFYDINLRPNCFTKERIEASLAHCDLLKLSDEELEVLRDLFDLKGSDESCLEKLRRDFDVEWIALTCGASGSDLFTPKGRFSSKPPRDIEVVDTVGAGDAWASILAAGYLQGWEPDTILKRANRFAGAVCGIQGAIPGDDRFYEPFSTWMEEKAIP